jgi:hypothetical protein
MGLVDGSPRIYVAVAPGGNGDLNRRPYLGLGLIQQGSPALCSGQEKGRLYAQRQRNPFDVVDRHVLFAPFKHAHVCSVYACTLG